MPLRPYVVRQGDYFTKLAHLMGFDADTVWNDPKNEELRRRRPHRDMLAPGDLLFVPDAPAAGPEIESGGTKRYKAAVPTVHLEVLLHDGQTPIADEPYVIEGLGPEQEGQTGGDGKIAFDAPVTTREVKVLLPRRRVVYPVHIGDLDPVEERSGVRQRLQHLGFYGYGLARAMAQMDAPSEEAQAHWDRAAIAAFQHAKNLEPTGEIDDATRLALSDTHGS
jgi:hypothetical protein